MNLTTPIATGNTAEVYDCDPGWILKLFKETFSRGNVEYEFNINQAVEKAGIPVPKTGKEILEIDGRFGILYEKIAGLPMGRMLEKQPWKMFAFARKMAELHAQMHENPLEVDGIPSIKERLTSKLNRSDGASDAIRNAALQALEAMSDGDRLCHGDFHPENILLDGQQSYIIDWVDAMIGSPLADVARTSVILLGEAATQNSWFVRQSLKLIHGEYLRHYFQLRSGGEDEFERWKPIIAAGRLSEGLDYQAEWLLEQAGKLLSAE